MITMRIGRQGIPLWFRCFDGMEGGEAYEEDLLKSGISYVSELFGSDYDLIFLAYERLTIILLTDGSIPLLL